MQFALGVATSLSPGQARSLWQGGPASENAERFLSGGAAPRRRVTDDCGPRRAVGKKRIALNRCSGAALWGLNRGGCRGGRGTRHCGVCHGS